MFLSLVLFFLYFQLSSGAEGDSEAQSRSWASEFVEENETLLCVENVDGSTFFWIGAEDGIKLGYRVWFTPPEDHRISWSFVREGQKVGISGGTPRILSKRVREVGERTVIAVVQLIPLSNYTEKGYKGVVQFKKYPNSNLKPSLTHEAIDQLPVVGTCDVSAVM